MLCRYEADHIHRLCLGGTEIFFHMPPPQVSLEYEFDRRQILTYKSFKLCRVLLENGRKSASKNQRQSRHSVKTKEKEKERYLRHWIRLWCQIVVSAVLKSMGGTRRNAWKPNISTSNNWFLYRHIVRSTSLCKKGSCLRCNCSLVSRNPSDLPRLITILSTCQSFGVKKKNQWLTDSLKFCSFIFWRRYFVRSRTRELCWVLVSFSANLPLAPTQPARQSGPKKSRVNHVMTFPAGKEILKSFYKSG